MSTFPEPHNDSRRDGDQDRTTNGSSAAGNQDGDGHQATPPPPGSSTSETDLFQAIDISEQQGRSASDEPARMTPPAGSSDSHTKWFRPMQNAEPKAVGANSLLPIESELEEVIEVSEKLMHVIDGLSSDAPEVVHAAIVDFVSRARTSLEEWGIRPPTNEAQRLERLASLRNTADELDTALDDLKLLAIYLSRVRPEEVYDLGTWRLIRRVRAGMRSVDLRELAELCRDLAEHLEGQPRTHLLASYLPRLESRYDRAVRNRVSELEPALTLEVASAEPAELLAAMLKIEPLGEECREFHQIYSHPEWERLLGLSEGKREQFLPALRQHVESLPAQRDLAGMLVLGAAFAEVPEPSRTYRVVAPLAAALAEAREGLLDEVRQAAQTGLEAEEPAPVAEALEQVRGLPEVLREPDSEFTELEQRLDSHLRELLATLEAEVVAALESHELEVVEATLSRLTRWAEARPEHPLVERLEPLRAHKQRLLEALAREREVQEAYESLAAQVRAALADAETPVAVLDALLDKVAAATTLDEALRAPLREDLLRRRQQLLDLHAALEAEQSAPAQQARERAEATMSGAERELFASWLAQATEHTEELAELEAHLQALAEFRDGLAHAEQADECVATGEKLVEAATGALAEPGAQAPGAQAPRQHLAQELTATRQILHELRLLAGSPAGLREALGDPAKLHDEQAPNAKAAAERAEKLAEEARATLEHAPRLQETCEHLRGGMSSFAEALTAWQADHAVLATGIRKGSVSPQALTKGEQALKRATAEAERVETLDEHLGFAGALRAWHKRHLSHLRHHLEHAGELAEVRRERAARLKRTLATVGLLLVLVAGGVVATLWWLDYQREQRAEALYAAGETLRDEPSEQVEEIGAWLGDSASFLEEPRHEEAYGERFAPLRMTLTEQRARIAALEAELAELRERLVAKEQALDTYEPATSPFPPLTEEIRAFRQRALERQRAEVEKLRLDSRVAHAQVLAHEGLETDRIVVVDAALAAVEQEVARKEDPPFAARAQPLLAELAARRAHLERAALVEELVAQGERAIDQRDVPPLQAFVSRGDAFLDEHGAKPPAERLLPLLSEARELAARLLERSRRFEALLAGAEEALAANELQPLAEAYTTLEQALTEETWPQEREAKLRDARDQLGLAWLAAVIARGLASEQPAEIAELSVEARRLVDERFPTELAAEGEARLAEAQPRLANRQQYFEAREIHEEALQEALAAERADLEGVRNRHRALHEEQAELLDYDTSRDAFGAEPPALRPVREQLALYGERRELLERASAGLALDTAETVRNELAELRTTLDEANERAAAHEATHAPALAPWLTLLERYAALLAQAEAGLETRTHDEALEAYEALVAELQRPDAEALREPVQPARERLRAHVAALEDPYADVEITLDVPERTDEDLINGAGTVSNAPDDLDHVHLYINGNHQRATVRNGRFESMLVLRSGENRVVVSPVEDAEHPRAIEREVFSTAERAAVQVTLTWNKDNTDLDLHVKQPNGIEINYRNRRPGGFNGYLDHDDTTGYGPENYRFRLQPGQQLPEGAFHVYVVYFSGREPVDFEVTLTFNPGLPEEEVKRFHGSLARENASYQKPVVSFEIDEHGELSEVRDARDDD